MSQGHVLVEKYERLLRDSRWPATNRIARRAIRELVRALEEATR